jgi:hypothetical protein
LHRSAAKRLSAQLIIRILQFLRRSGGPRTTPNLPVEGSIPSRLTTLYKGLSGTRRNYLHGFRYVWDADICIVAAGDRRAITGRHQVTVDNDHDLDARVPHLVTHVRQ